MWIRNEIAVKSSLKLNTTDIDFGKKIEHKAKVPGPLVDASKSKRKKLWDEMQKCQGKWFHWEKESSWLAKRYVFTELSYAHSEELVIVRNLWAFLRQFLTKVIKIE